MLGTLVLVSGPGRLMIGGQFIGWGCLHLGPWALGLGPWEVG